MTTGERQRGHFNFDTVEEYRALLDNLHAGVVVHAADTSILVCNATSSQLLGLTVEQMTRKTAIDPAWCFTAEDGTPMPLEDYPVNRVLASGEPLRNFLVGINRPLGQSVVWALCNAFPFHDAQGELERIVVTFIDVSDQRRAQEEARQLEAQLLETQRMESIGKLAGGVAHDFNNLLTAIIGACDLARLRGNDPQELQRRMGDIRRTAMRATDLTQQLLAFGRKQILQPRLVDINDVINGFLPILKRLVSEAIELRLELSDEPVPVLVDPVKIEQVIVNLAVNARDAMPDGGVLTIETRSVELDDDYARSRPDVKPGAYGVIVVSDQGVGMDAATRARAFEPFFTTKDRSQGTGLGLATVFGVVKQSDGHIWLYSEPGEGTTFKIHLPLQRGVPDSLEIGETLERAPELMGTEGVLVVEDEEEVCELVQLILERFGYTVHTAGNPDEAVRRFRTLEGDVCLLLTDVVLPGASGKQLATQLTIGNPDLKVLYMSGYTDNVIVHHGMLERGTHLIEKPFSAIDLARRVRQVLDS